MWPTGGPIFSSFDRIVDFFGAPGWRCACRDDEIGFGGLLGLEEMGREWKTGNDADERRMQQLQERVALWQRRGHDENGRGVKWCLKV